MLCDSCLVAEDVAGHLSGTELIARFIIGRQMFDALSKKRRSGRCYGPLAIAYDQASYQIRTAFD